VHDGTRAVPRATPANLAADRAVQDRSATKFSTFGCFEALREAWKTKSSGHDPHRLPRRERRPTLDDSPKTFSLLRRSISSTNGRRRRVGEVGWEVVDVWWSDLNRTGEVLADVRLAITIAKARKLAADRAVQE